MDWRHYKPGQSRSIVRSLMADPNGARVMQASVRQMHRELVRLVHQSEASDPGIRRRALQEARNLARFLREISEVWNDDAGTWR